MDLRGKRLLILGATPNEIPLIRRAQSMGIYVIVTDYNLDHRISPSKDVADEYWDVSWSDIDTLEKLCKEKGINGVTAGFSEFRVDSMINLTARLNLPCYVTADQLAITRDKALFKAECEKYGVPTIHAYFSLKDVDHFPVIVKPVDRAGSIGVGIAWNEEELQVAYCEAVEKSVVKQVIIEDYITNATEVDVHYAICDGEISLLCTDDIIAAANNQADGKVVQSVWLYPCRYEECFLKNVDPAMRNMIQGLGIENGTIFFSGFSFPNGDFSFFECGFRLWGEQEFEFDYRKGAMNYLDIYIIHALTGDLSALPRNEKGNKKLKGAAINFYVKGGTIKSISGFDEVAQMNDCTLALLDGYEGQKCDGDKAILSKSALFGFANESAVSLEQDLLFAYEKYQVISTTGEDMIYDRIPAGTVANWWKK